MRHKGLNILITTPHFPYPLVGGERIKLYNLIRHLSSNNKIYLVSMDRGFEINEQYIEHIKSLNVDVYSFNINKIQSLIRGSFLSLFRNPLEVEYFSHDGFSNCVNHIITTQNIDLVINLFVRTAEHVKKLPVKKILLAEDCRSYYQQRTSKVTRNIFEKVRRKIDSIKLAKYESQIVNHFDVTTLVTENDINCMKSLNPNSKFRLLTQGVDTDYFRPPESYILRDHILFLGKLDVLANQLMVNKIVQDIFPKIEKNLPNAKLIIAGANPTKEIINYKTKNIDIVSNPSDIVRIYQSAAIFLHPHAGGSGIQNKVLEAMSCECAVITSPSGSNGIDIVNNVNGFIANNDEDFVSLCINLLNNETHRNIVGQNARKYVVNTKSWDKVFSDLDNIIEEL